VTESHTSSELEFSAVSAFAAYLRRLRVHAGLTQEALAERAGLSSATIGAIEEGLRRRPYPQTVRALADALALTSSERETLMDAATAFQSQPRHHAAPSAPDSPRERVAPGVPSTLTPLVGREAEIAAVGALLRPPHVQARLLTLLGPAGVGKTRLAVAVANTLHELYADGVTWVDLASVRDHRLVPATIARAVDLRESAGRSAVELLRLHLHDLERLLVLDNFEHLLPSASLLADLLVRCPRLAILVTSRTALRLLREQRFPVQPLPTPEASPDLTAIAASPAVQLFVERARAAVDEFALDHSNAAAVASVCRRVEGLPLTIELAAAWVHLLSPTLLLRRLEGRLLLLSDGPADLPERQRTLRDTLAWSHDLLEPGEQLLFRRLAVFGGGCTLEAAEIVCADAALSAVDLLEHLERLTDSSLIYVVRSDGEPRFSMLHTVREYAVERLDASEDADILRARLLDWCLNLVETVPPLQLDARQVESLEREQDNLRAALRVAIDTDQAGPGLRLAAGCWPLWFLRGVYAEGGAWFADLLALPSAQGQTVSRATGLAWAGHLAYCQGAHTSAEALLREGQHAAEHAADQRALGLCLHVLGHVARAMGQPDIAWSMYERRLAIAEQLDDWVGQALTLWGMANLSFELGEPERAESLAARALALFRPHDHVWGVARAQYELGRVADRRGDHELARQLLAEALGSQRQIQDRQGLTWSLLALALASTGLADDSSVRALLGEGLALAWESGDRLSLVHALEGIVLLVAPEDPEAALRLAASAQALRQTLNAVPYWYERERLEHSTQLARTALGSQFSAAVWTVGSGLELEQVVGDAAQLIRVEPSR
jgi:predicted ATPase/transcriptional regulator with XRE-family HTH domain